MKLIYLFMTVLFVTCLGLKDLKEIRYRYTSCGATGREGPTVSQCQTYYADKNSDKPDRFFSFSSEDDAQLFQGAQGFRVATSGLYNVTIAGAAGGRGICSSQQGRGLLWRGMVKLRDIQDLFVLVGQPGAEPCEFLEEITMCKKPPKRLEESEQCFKAWYNWLNTNPSLSQSEANNIYMFGGGGGGGGGSMLRVRSRVTGLFDDLPLVIAGGGGGSGANMSVNFFNLLKLQRPPKTLLRELYTTFINAKSSRYDAALADIHNFTGIRGYISPQVNVFNNRAGAGGGYYPAKSLYQDGAALNSSALGGFDCLHLSTDLNRRPLLELVHGGFGGGGGQCESGGGGGGYSGGSIFSNRIFGIPGNGGFSGYFSEAYNVTELSVDLNDELDGFVEIVPANCGCRHQCIIYQDLDMFDCTCPDGFNLAPNEYDCYEGVQFNVSEGGYELYDRYTVKEVQFGASIEVLSTFSAVNIQAVNDSSSSGTVGAQNFCFIVLLDSNGDISLYSNVVRETFKMINELTPFRNGTFGESSHFLDAPYSVTSAVLVSDNLCLINDGVLKFNVSSDPAGFMSSSFKAANIEAVLSLARSLSNPSTDSVMPSNDTVQLVIEPNVTGKTLLISLVLSALASFVLIYFIAFVVIRACYRRNKKPQKPPLHVTSNVYFNAPKDASLVYNRMYVGNTSANTPTATSDVSQSFTVIELPGQEGSIQSSVWEHSRRNLVYMKELGEGHFGKVLLMEAKEIADLAGRIPVAVKTLSSTDPVVVRKFTDEANLMKTLSHANIVTLLAVIFEDVDEDNAPMMILEYMPYGDLRGFLTKRRVGLITGISEIGQDDFYSFARDVASGVAFLLSKGYVHRDIACRNCLVGLSLNIKLADFGMTKKLNKNGIYRAEGDTLLPVKWASPESLLGGIFSHASDIWSYGVFLWEVVTYGELPLGKISNGELQAMAEAKTLKHSRPQNCPDRIYEVMTLCHQYSPQDRISIEDILQRFSHGSTEAHDNNILQVSMN